MRPRARRIGIRLVLRCGINTNSLRRGMSEAIGGRGGSHEKSGIVDSRNGDVGDRLRGTIGQCWGLVWPWFCVLRRRAGMGRAVWGLPLSLLSLPGLLRLPALLPVSVLHAVPLLRCARPANLHPATRGRASAAETGTATGAVHAFSRRTLRIRSR